MQRLAKNDHGMSKILSIMLAFPEQKSQAERAWSKDKTYLFRMVHTG